MYSNVQLHSLMTTVCSDYAIKTLTNESFPGSRVFTLSPAIRPAHHHSVVFHPPQTAGLNEMNDALPHFSCNDNLAETFDPLNLHHVLNGL